MFEDPKPQKTSEFPMEGEPTCDICGEAIDLGMPESYHVVYWQCYKADIFTHIACF